MSQEFFYDEKKAISAFRAFLKWIAMDFAEDDEHYDVKYDKLRGYVVMKDGEIDDERGELFMSIQNIFSALYPNTPYRGEDYIFSNHVNHAHWISNPLRFRSECSFCGYQRRWDGIDKHMNGVISAKYCEWCGAKLDEVNDNAID